MFQKILVAYSASEHSAIALRQAAELASFGQSELHMLGIVVTTGAVALAETTSGTGSFLSFEHERISKALESASSDLRKQGLNVSMSVLKGDAANEIIATAHRIKADLAVIGHSNKGVLARWFQGSVGARLMSELPCSLLIAADK